MDKLLKAVFQVQEFKFRTDDDLVDRLSRRYTPTLLVLFTVLVSVKQYVGNPIDCWSPAQFTTAHVDYTNTVCWVSNTYYVPFSETMPLATQPRRHISYYQWVPLILLFQAALCFVPCMLWRFLNRRVGINLSALVESGRSCLKAIYPETKEKTLRYMVLQVDAYLTRQHRGGQGGCSRIKYIMARHCCLFCSMLTGNYLTCTYMVVKFLYVVNAVGQLFLLDIFLGMGDVGHSLYGFHAIFEFITGKDWSLSERFPRVTLCDFQIRQQTNVHRYTVQCVLPINLFNEKIFIFLWFWLLIVAMTTTICLMRWLANSVLLSTQVRFVKRQLKSLELHRKDAKFTRKFTEDYLGRDGLFIVRIVSHNAGDLVAAELLYGLWSNYASEHRSLSRGNTQRPTPTDTTHSAPSSAQIDKGTRWNTVHRIILGHRRHSERPVSPQRAFRTEEV